jgi:hypothetical protein
VEILGHLSALPYESPKIFERQQKFKINRRNNTNKQPKQQKRRKIIRKKLKQHKTEEYARVVKLLKAKISHLISIVPIPLSTW